MEQKSGGNTMEERFEQRINQYVEEQLESALSGPPAGQGRRARRGCLFTVVLVAAAIVTIVLLVQLAF